MNKYLLVLLLFLCNNALAFEQKIIFCPPQKGSDYPTIYKTYINEKKEEKITMVKKIDDPPSQGVPYFVYNDLGGGNYTYSNISDGDIARWISVKKFPDTQAFIWSSTYFLKEGILSENIAFITDDELSQIIEISKNNPDKIEQAKLELFNKKKSNNQIDDSVVYQNCRIE